MINIIEHYALGERVYDKVMYSLSEKYHLTHMEMNIIMFLYNNKDKNTASDIIRYKKLSKSHVSTSIQSLCDKGLLTKSYLDNNHKTIYLYLSDSSLIIAREGKVLQNEFYDIALSGFNDSERKLLYSFINRIDKNLENYN